MRSYRAEALSTISEELLEGTRTFAEAWNALEKGGLARVSVPEEAGGDGGTLADAAAVLRIAGYRGLSLPVAETSLLVGWALTACGLRVPAGPLTLAPVHFGDRIEFHKSQEGWTLHGRARRVPWARDAERICIVGYAGDGIFVGTVKTRECEIADGENLAGEPRDDVSFHRVRLNAQDVAPVSAEINLETIRLRGAMARALLMAGALDRILELAVEHARERQQFGRPIGRFQAVQQQLALLAGEVTASNAAVGAAVEAAASETDPRKAHVEIAAAKARTGLAASSAATIAHQVHGAVGFTERHPLHINTLRLWSWREEFGAESEWLKQLGRMLMRGGPDSLWSAVTHPASILEGNELARDRS